jgi:hypothetical protein
VRAMTPLLLITIDVVSDCCSFQSIIGTDSLGLAVVLFKPQSNSSHYSYRQRLRHRYENIFNPATHRNSIAMEVDFGLCCSQRTIILESRVLASPESFGSEAL